MQGNKGKIEKKNTSMVIYQNQLKQDMKLKLPFYGPTCAN